MQQIFNLPVHHVPVDADEWFLFDSMEDICYSGVEGDQACPEDTWFHLDGITLAVWRILCGGH